MDKFNVCKFPSYANDYGLKVKAFVLEKDENIIKSKKALNRNYLFLITDGIADITFNQTLKYKVCPGDLIFGFKGENFYCENLNNLEYAYLDFDGWRVQDLFDRFNIGKDNRIFSNCDFLIPFWKESLFNANESNTDLASESVLLYSFSKLTAVKSNTPNLIDKITKLTLENFTSASFSLSWIAKTLNYNEKYLSHLFKLHTKTGFAEYLRSLRIKNAVSLFDVGLESVKNVAYLSGFSDPLYFSNVFKKEIGVSPKHYKSNKNTKDNSTKI